MLGKVWLPVLALIVVVVAGFSISAFHGIFGVARKRQDLRCWARPLLKPIRRTSNMKSLATSVAGVE